MGLKFYVINTISPLNLDLLYSKINVKVADRPYFRDLQENCSISAFTAPRHLKVGRKTAYTIIMNIFLSGSNYVGNNMARNRSEAL